MTIVLEGLPYILKDFLFSKVDLAEHLASNEHASTFLTRWISGGKEFEISTSGSTGFPKIIKLKRKWLEASALQTINLLNLWDENVLCCLPTNKIGGLMMLVRALAGGFNINIMNPEADPMRGINIKHNFTFIALTPYQLVKILEVNESMVKLNQFKNILLGGSMVSEDLIKKIYSLSPNIYHTYGMTETCSHIALKKLNNGAWPHFVPNPFIEIKTDSQGCASIKGFQTGDEWVNSTDIIHMYNDNSFDFLGRADFVINTGGFKVFPESLEFKIYKIFQSNNIECNFSITSVPDPNWGEAIILASDIELNEADMFKILKAALNKFELPKKLIKVKNIPLLPNGKTDRIKLKTLA